MKSIKLSTGDTVQLKERWTHGMEKAFDLALFKDGGKATVKTAYEAYETVLPMLLEKIERGGATVEWSVGWLDDLPEPDYKLIVKTVDEISSLDKDKEKKGN